MSETVRMRRLKMLRTKQAFSTASTSGMTDAQTASGAPQLGRTVDAEVKRRLRECSPDEASHIRIWQVFPSSRESS